MPCGGMADCSTRRPSANLVATNLNGASRVQDDIPAIKAPAQGNRLRAALADQRVLQVLGQLLFVILAVAVFWSLGNTAAGQLRDKGLVPTFGYLELRSGFEIR